MNEPLIITNSDDTYILVSVSSMITREHAERVRTGWHDLVNNNERVHIVLFSVGLDGIPVRVA